MKTRASCRTHFSKTPLDILLDNSEQRVFGYRFLKTSALTVQHFHLDYIAEPTSVTWCQECYVNPTKTRSLISLILRPVMLPIKQTQLAKED